jgi:diguanylate cyclase
VLRTQSVITGLEDRSLIDSLTRLGNRRMFESRLRAAVSERTRSPRPLAWAYIDIDGFQTINKFYGEPLGDTVLMKIADVIRETYRLEDVACRLRDDDFAILMPDTTLNRAVALARNVKLRLSKAHFTYRDATIPVTCGIGIATALDLYDRTVLDRAIEALEQTLARKSDELCVWESLDPSAAAAPLSHR